MSYAPIAHVPQTGILRNAISPDIPPPAQPPRIPPLPRHRRAATTARMLRKLYDWTLAKAAHPHATGWLALFCFMEASFFPIPPHPLLGLMCLAEPKRAVRFALIATFASVAGGLLGYAIGHYLYASIGAQLLDWLGLTESFPKAACYMREYGAEIILIKGATPIPFKLLTITAGFIHMPLFTFLWASLASRGFMFLTVGILFRLFGAPIKAFIDKYLGLVTAAFLVLMVGGLLAITLLGGGGKDESRCGTATTVAAPATAPAPVVAPGAHR